MKLMFNILRLPQISVRTAVNLSFKIVEERPSRAPPILLFHGLLGTKKYWSRLGKTISVITKRSVAAVDLRNHGYSPHVDSHTYKEMAEDVLQLYDNLGIETASLVGHGMGGRTSMCVALMQPKKVAELLLVDVSPISTPKELTEPFPKIMAAMKNVNFQGIKKVKAARKKARKQLRDIIANNDILMRTIYLNINVKKDGTIGWICNLDTLIKQFGYIASFPYDLKEMTYPGPTLFLGGQLSDYIPPDDLTGIREIFPQAVIKYVKETGHNLHIEDPKSFLEYTIAFLREKSD